MATTKAKALLASMATTLADEATAAGKSGLATALTEFAGEIAATDDEDFFVTIKFDSAGTATTTSGKGLTYANILQGAASVVQSKGINALTNIKDSQSTIATAETAIAAETATVAAKQTVIANKQTAIESYQKRMRELAEGVGIRTITPSELIGLAKMFQIMIEQGKILGEEPPVSDAKQAEAKAKVKELSEKVQDLLKSLGTLNF